MAINGQKWPKWPFRKYPVEKIYLQWRVFIGDNVRCKKVVNSKTLNLFQQLCIYRWQRWEQGGGQSFCFRFKVRSAEKLGNGKILPLDLVNQMNQYRTTFSTVINMLQGIIRDYCEYLQRILVVLYSPSVRVSSHSLEGEDKDCIEEEGITQPLPQVWWQIRTVYFV